MIVLGIESSCDETAAALVEDGRTILSSVVASQVSIHRDYGGVVPELASREHVDNICFVVDEALREAQVGWEQLDAIAVTQGPGLVGALLVGLAYAKALAYSLGLPFLGVNHLEGHVYSVFMDHPEAETPALSLVVSGGHTNLYFLRGIGEYELLAKTRDDAAGEALDKLSKFLGLGYPGGPVIERLAKQGDSQKVRFTMPKITDGSTDFSFSGIKTAALRFVKKNNIERIADESENATPFLPPIVLDLVASYQQAIIEQLINRLEKALSQSEARSIHVSGGVSCNKALREQIASHFESKGIPVYAPQPSLTTDNAAMIAAAGYLRLKNGAADTWDLPADPNLKLGQFS
jgi:N6-L-threonylcarbamoyladenine synthase